MLDFELSPELQELQIRARKVAAEGVADYGMHTDSWINGYSKEFSKRLAEEGWIGMTWPVEYGGGGQSNLARIIMGEAMISAGAPIAASWFADRQMGPALFTYGTEDQQAEFLPGMLSGETTWCIGMSEPDAGSDLAGLKTSAVRDGDVFVVNGQKIWTSFAADADYCYLICRTSSDGPPHKGVSELIVPMDLPGIEVRPITDMTTNRHFCEVYFDDVRVPPRTLSVSRATPSSRRWPSSNTSGAASIGSSLTSRCTTVPSRQPTRATPGSARRSPASRPGTDSAGCSSTARR